MLRVHFFSSAYQRQLLVDRKVGGEEYGSMWLKILPHIKPVVSLSMITMSSVRSRWKREEMAFSLIMKKEKYTET